MKRYMAVLAAAVILISMIGAVLPFAVRAQETATYMAQTVQHVGTIKAGETVTVLIYMEPVSAVSSLQATLCYDPERLEAVSGETQNFLKTDMIQSYVNTAPIDTSTGEAIPGEVLVNGFSLADITVTTRTAIASITLRALEDIDTDVSLTFKNVRASRNPTIKLECGTVDGAICIVRGDANGDGAIDTSDALAVFYAVNGVKALTVEQQAEADMDRDGYVTLRDAVTLFYYVNGKI